VRSISSWSVAVVVVISSRFINSSIVVSGREITSSRSPTTPCSRFSASTT